MQKHSYLLVLVVGLLYPAIAGAQQYPLIDKIAEKIVQKYQTSSCAELAQEKAQKKQPSQEEEKIIQRLRSEPKMRQEFINKIAAPIANKLFECGMIPLKPHQLSWTSEIDCNGM